LPAQNGTQSQNPPAPSAGSPRTLTIAVTAAAAAATALAVAFPSLSLAVGGVTAHVAIEAAATVIAFLAAFLFYGRFKRSGRLLDLAVLGALEVLALTNLCFSTLPLAAGAHYGSFLLWAPVGGRLLAAAALAGTAVVRDRRVRSVRPAVLAVLAGGAVAVAAVGGIVAVLAPHLPATLAAPGWSESELVPSASPGVLAVQGLGVALFAIAALGFARQARIRRDPLLTWFAAGSALAALAWVNYLLFPATYLQVVGLGDLLRLLFYLTVLVGVVREIARYQRHFAESAVLAERRRVARELHDGLAQELAFLASYGRTLAKRGAEGPGNVQPLVQAAERALGESREVVRDLARPPRESFDTVLAQAARDVADRAGVNLKLELDPRADPEAATRHSLVRIVREAVNNAANHARAQEVVVSLGALPRLRVSVSDDGVGFDPRRGDGSGYGLVSMRERADAFGGTLWVDSQPGHGTTITVLA
jgi:signal transduction histidine kinase